MINHQNYLIFQSMYRLDISVGGKKDQTIFNMVYLVKEI